MVEKDLDYSLVASKAQTSSEDIIARNWSSQTQTFIIPLTFPCLSTGTDKATITRIGYGGDVWELRVDLLTETPPLGTSNLPSVSYVRDQLHYLQSWSPLPILFTIRTVSQGGKFPDDAHEEALQLMLMAIEEGCKYLDVEIEWPKSLVEKLLQRKQATQIIASYHSWTGEIRWTSKTLKDKYLVADEFGDIIKLSILATDLYDCHELAFFVRSHQQTREKPLLAVAMGADGQLSRITSPISLVTHQLIPFPSAPGQITLAEVMKAKHLMGQLSKEDFVAEDERAAAMHNAGFKELGLPYKCSAKMQERLPITQIFLRDSLAHICKQFSEWTRRPAPVEVMVDVGYQVEA